MLFINCPHCGLRDSAEFTYGGDASVARPADPEAASDADWIAYLFMRANPKGPHLEYWFHRDGCRAWINVKRSTVTHDVNAVFAGNR